jgi:Ca2+-binding EF-hand superfamily protein
MEQQFTAMDKDKNGQVSLAEFKAAATAKVSPNAEAALQRFDANKDGKVSATEFRAPVLATFDQVDANKDGIVTQDEARKSATQR